MPKKRKNRDWINEIIDELERIIGPDWKRFGDPEWFDQQEIYVRFDIDGFHWFAEPAVALKWLKTQPDTTEAKLAKKIESEKDIFFE